MMKNALATDYWANALGIEAAHFEAMSQGETAGPTADQSGPLESGPTDTVPDTITGNNPELIVGESATISTIDAPGDQDVFKVELQAGQTYEIGQYATTEGPTGVPLSDAFLELYDAAGNFIASADGGGPDTPSGLDALLTFRPEQSGTYYVKARAFDNAPEDGTNGEIVGDYEIFARESTYEPYYSVDSPLHSIDWGTQVDGTGRNPDGAEGPRPTGNPASTPANDFGIEGKNVITYYFAQQGDVFVTEDPSDPGLTDTIVASGMAEWEKNAFESAFDEFAEVADVVYVEVFNREEADFKLITYNGTPNFGILGRMSPPDTNNEGQAEFNRNGPGWNEEQLQRGGFSYITLIHELGHGHGMAHPHDNGGRSSVMRGVESTGGAFDYTLGAANLNQGIYTMMSYQDGWATSPYGNSPDDGYGYLGSLMAFDIAVIQDKYGVNEETRTGNDNYVMKDVNAQGTWFESIWDAGGVDQIIYNGERDTRIDLRDATLQYEHGGGGFLSYAYGIYGGYTIANSVTIENARSDDGKDRLVGNEVRNMLHAGGGDDIVQGREGNDSLYGEDGNDLLLGGFNNDAVFGGTGADRVRGQGGNDYAAGENGNDRVGGGNGRDRVLGGAGDDEINGNLGDDLVVGGTGADMLRGGSGGDMFGFAAGDAGTTLATADRILDFSRDNGDKISLGQIDAVAGTDANEAFAFIGRAAFSGTAGELRYFAGKDGHAYVQMDMDGDKVSDFAMIVEGRSDLLATDFVL